MFVSLFSVMFTVVFAISWNQWPNPCKTLLKISSRCSHSFLHVVLSVLSNKDGAKHFIKITETGKGKTRYIGIGKIQVPVVW